MQTVLNCQVLERLATLLDASVKESIRKEAAWTVSNITAGSRTQIQAVIDANSFPVLIHVLAKGEFKTRKEAAWAISNVSSGGSPSQIEYLVNLGCIPPLCDLLTVMDANIVQVALTGLENILRVGATQSPHNNPYAMIVEECYGLDKIEFLQSHENMEIYQKSFDLIEKYFGSEEGEEDAAVAPAVAAGGSEFTFGEPTAAPSAGSEFPCVPEPVAPAMSVPNELLAQVQNQASGAGGAAEQQQTFQF